MEPLQNPGQLPNSQLDQNVLRQKIIIQALCCFCFIYCTIYLQALCMISKVCGMDGTEAPLFAEQSIIAFYVFTLIFLLFIYHSVANVKQNIITFLKWPVLLYAIVAGIFGIVCFIQNGTIQKSDLIQNWNRLSQYRRTNRYTSNIDNLLSYNKLNLIIIAIYHIVYAIVLGIIFGFLFNFQMIIPENWRPPFQSRLIVPSPLIYKPLEYIPQKSKLNEEDEKIDEEKEEVPAPITVFQQQKPKAGRFQRKQVQDVESQSQLQQSQLQQSQQQQSQVNAPF